MRVEEVYRPEAFACEATDSLSEAASKMTSRHVGALAVVDGNRLVGILSERDVVRAVAEGVDLLRAGAGSHATLDVETAKLAEDTTDIARRMLDAGIRHLPVVRDHTVVGMISMRDALAVEAWL
ncbi:CBS domain-containing protein [Actinopolymorpha cephalotaxi]|uniref:CBS domain-containing protein n=1 Tax=Actinopolymorpha cephalotaxi TaxID=504797 RepID=A0A1I3C0N0_9ACTN|nr:CBS domain-containing protein [Actinopolymorpha cephalotaxi]NYH84068.1 CBS domain-containing protein [Actinopolymorpha cephalotaxi]SFH68125.1 CBS domain-containing protein [Actinopolymorpha cephalotaxi]